MKGLIYIDVSSEERYGEGLDELLRLVYEQPFHQKPKLGGAPAFLANGGTSYVKELGAAIRAIQDGRPNRQGLETLFIKGVLTEVDKLYVTPTGNDYHEGVYQAIAGTKGLRDQVADYAETVAAFSADDPSSVSPFIKLMEGLGAHFGPPTTSGEFYPGWADLYSYFALEAFLIQTAALIRHSRWKSLRRLLDATYVVRGSQGEPTTATFVSFDTQLVSLDEHRNRGLNLNRVSVSADLLKERCSPDKTGFNEVMEADILLALKAVARVGGDSTQTWPSYWAPRTCVYASYGNKFPLFMRTADVETRTGVHVAIGVNSGADLKARFEKAGNVLSDLGRIGSRAFSHFNFLEAINANELLK